MNLQHEKDLERLRQAALLLEAENKRLVSKVVELSKQLATVRGEDARVLQQRLAELEAQLAKRNKMLFGASSERRPDDKPPAESKTPPEKAPRKKGHGPRAQPNLPIVTHLHVLDEADRVCTACGGELKEWKGQHEESEEIDVVSRQFVMNKHLRQKYRCSCGGCVETSPGALKLFEGARYSINFAIEVAMNKYLDHLPLERQVRSMARDGLDVDSQTLWDYLERLAVLLKPAYNNLWALCLNQPVVGVDETRWPQLNAPKEERSKWHAWVLATTTAVFYRIADNRGADAARELLKDYRGNVMADGYAVYESLAKSGNFALAQCWAHVRREYIDIADKFPQVEQVLSLIGQLYEVEKLAGTGPPAEELRHRLRQEKSRPLLLRIQAWAMEQRALPESGLGKAISYMGGRWKGLVRFLEDPRIPLDNNATERAIRGPVVGRKNHYGSKSRRGTEVAALFYSLCETAKLVNIDPRRYLRIAVRAALDGGHIPLPHQLPEKPPAVAPPSPQTPVVSA